MTARLATLLQDALGHHYRLERELEAGGMSRLFLATDVKLNRPVVVKVLPPDLVSTTSIARFKREIELTVRLQHPHILPILTSGEWEDGLYYVAPYIEGESLRERIARERKLPLDDILKILKDVCGALAFAHQRGIAHRDIKPGNILLADGHAILADFGIARAVSTTATPLTESGVAPGTPAYMAPELPTDERADVYSLGVVAYEMLCGTLPPQLVTAGDVTRARGRLRSDSRSRARGAARVIAAALHRSADQRINTAQAFQLRLDAIDTLHPRRITLLFAAAIATAAAAATYVAARRNTLTLNPDKFVVVAIGSRDSAADGFAQRLADALVEWKGISVGEPAALRAQLANLGSTIALNDGLSAARALRARHLIALTSLGARDSLILRVAMYDAASDTAERVKRVAMSVRMPVADRTMSVRQLINDLLREGNDLPWKSSTDQAVPSIQAWRSYDRGRLALRVWSLSEAESAFRSALADDPQFAAANLWLAQTLAWAGNKPKSEVSLAAGRAVDLLVDLSGRDSLHAIALHALATNDFVKACDVFRKMLLSNPADLAGELGVADCMAKDPVVVRDARSKTGFVFRGSFEEASRSYHRAAQVSTAPPDSRFSGWLLGRMSTVLYAVTNRVRLGYTVDGRSNNFGGLPFLDHDTLAFAPYPTTALAAGDLDPDPNSVDDAIRRNREVLRGVAEEWVRQAPTNAAALDSLAGWAEITGGVARIGNQSLGPLEIVRLARIASHDSVQQVRLAIAEVRLHLKSGRFGEARRIADSILTRQKSISESNAVGLAGLAGFLGHIEQAARLLAARHSDRLIQLQDGRVVEVSVQIWERASRLLVYSAFGEPADSIRRLATRTSDLIRGSYPDSATAAELRGALVASALALTFPTAKELLREFPGAPDPTTQGMISLARGDTAQSRRSSLQSRRVRRGRVRGSDVDREFRRARLALALGDSAAAADELDPALRALPILGTSLFDEFAQITSLIRAFILRADLAANWGDTATAREYADAVATSWRGADSPLQPVVRRMALLARTTPIRH